jgi:hypothetical protein
MEVRAQDSGDQSSALSLEVREELLKAQGYRIKAFAALDRAFGTNWRTSWHTSNKNRLSAISRVHHREVGEAVDPVGSTDETAKTTDQLLSRTAFGSSL